MAETWSIRGRQIDRADLQQIESWLKTHPQWSRRRLSEELAGRWDWRTPSGQLKDIATRDVLNRLEALGLICLPARQRRGGRQRPQALGLPQQAELGLVLKPEAASQRPGPRSQQQPLSGFSPGAPPDERFALCLHNLKQRAWALLEGTRDQLQEEKVRQRLYKQRDHLFTFLERPEVPATNNLAERQLRPAVIARKISCGNKTPKGALAWAQLNSVAVTCKQTGRFFIAALIQAFRLPQSRPP